MQIRASTDSDKQQIQGLHQHAFGDPEGKSVAQLAIDLIEDETAYPILSLVADIDNKIVGHILFSSIQIDHRAAPAAYILAPLAVASDMQGAGVGTALIRSGLEILKQRNAVLVLVLGDPNYYSRAGFSADHNLKPPYDLDYPQAWMARELKAGALETICGAVRCAAALNSPQHW